MDQKGSGLGRMTYFLILGHPVIYESDEATNVNLCSRIEGKEY